MGISGDPNQAGLPWRRRAAPPEERPTIPVCANCLMPLTGPGATAQGPYAAWHNQCQPCYDRGQERMELAEDRPGGQRVQVYRCLDCGDQRSCRPGWRTRCHVCLDERSNADGLERASKDCLVVFAHDPMLGLRVGRGLNLEPDEPITPRAIVQAMSCLTVAEALARFERPGWTVVATDVWGLPWSGVRSRTTSHGTWGRHDGCGAVALMRASAMDCPACGPQPGSRTHRARQHDPYLLYHVTIKGLTKFGVGTEDRVRAHQRAGANVVQVLRATFAEVVMAERKLKTSHASDIVGRKTRKMPTTFGQGTEVLARRRTVNLTEALTGAEDVTYLFQPTGLQK